MKCDIYSFGILVLEIIACESPFKECSNFTELIWSKEAIRLPLLLFRVNDLPVFHFVCKCLIPDPAYRPTAQELLDFAEFFKDTNSEKLAITISEVAVHS